MKKIITIILLLSLAAAPCYAINFLEKMIYREDVIKFYNSKVLVVPITGEIKYIWCGNPSDGYWMPVSGRVKQQYQALYDRQNAIE